MFFGGTAGMAATALLASYGRVGGKGATSVTVSSGTGTATGYGRLPGSWGGAIGAPNVVNVLEVGLPPSAGN